MVVSEGKAGKHQEGKQVTTSSQEDTELNSSSQVLCTPPQRSTDWENSIYLAAALREQKFFLPAFHLQQAVSTHPYLWA